jgi:S1-C subfamily serine protease
MRALTIRALGLGALMFAALPLTAVTVQAHDPPHRGRFPPPIALRHGLEVTRVLPGSPAALAGLERGDVIFEVDGRKVRTPDELHRALHQTGHRGVLTVRDIRTGRYLKVHIFTRGGHIGVSVTPLILY